MDTEISSPHAHKFVFTVQVVEGKTFKKKIGVINASSFNDAMIRLSKKFKIPRQYADNNYSEGIKRLRQM